MTARQPKKLNAVMRSRTRTIADLVCRQRTKLADLLDIENGVYPKSQK
jgi:hypothetical protein